MISQRRPTRAIHLELRRCPPLSYLPSVCGLLCLLILTASVESFVATNSRVAERNQPRVSFVAKHDDTITTTESSASDNPANTADPEQYSFLAELFREEGDPTATTSSSNKNNYWWTNFGGQADRSLRRALALERLGQARQAAAGWHEAVSLYQCWLDSPTAFGHVTALSSRSAIALVVAYSCTRLAFLNRDALGDPVAATRLYETSLQLDDYRSASAWRGMGESLEAAAVPDFGQSLQQALVHYSRALQIQPSRTTLFLMAVAMDRLGSMSQSDDSETTTDWSAKAQAILDNLRRDEAEYACRVDSWGYVRWHMRHEPHLNVARGTRSMLELALTAAWPLMEQGGLVCEFGVGAGRSLRMTQEILPLGQPIHGFDSFTGLPQAWGLEPAGAFSTGGMVPSIEGSVFFYKGMFSETIGPFLQDQGGDHAFLAYGNIDCRLFSSTLDVLEAFHGHIRPGTILVFDDYICHPSWRQDEFRAWRECCKSFGWKYEYLAFSLSTRQAVVRVTQA